MPRPALALSLVLFAGGVVSAQSPIRLVGEWHSETSGHHGPMRARLTPSTDGYGMRVFGRFAAVFPFAYRTHLDVVGVTPEGPVLAAGEEARAVRHLPHHRRPHGGRLRRRLLRDEGHRPHDPRPAALMPPVVLINAVGLTPRLLRHAPRLQAVAAAGWSAPLAEVLPAVTCTAQATLLTGEPPDRHGVVANGWLFRDTNEVRFWQQNNGLIQAEPLYATAKHRAANRGKAFTSAKLFWWFNQGADVEWGVTPKPWYALDGNKAFDVSEHAGRNYCGSA